MSEVKRFWDRITPETLLTLVAMFSSLCVIWGTLHQRVGQLESQITALTQRVDSDSAKLLEIYRQLSEVSTNIDWIKDALMGDNLHGCYKRTD